MAFSNLLEAAADFLGVTEKTVLIGALVLFVFSANFLLNSFRSTLFVGIMSALFPFFAIPVFGLDMPLNMTTILYFAFLGTALYHLYELGRLLLKGGGFLWDLTHAISITLRWIWRFIRGLFVGKKRQN